MPKRVSSIITVAKTGNIRLPKSIRDQLVVHNMSVDYDGEKIILKPIKKKIERACLKILLGDKPGALSEVTKVLSALGIDLIESISSSIIKHQLAIYVTNVDLRNCNLQNLEELRKSLEGSDCIKNINIWEDFRKLDSLVFEETEQRHSEHSFPSNQLSVMGESSLPRKTLETSINVKLVLDGTGETQINTKVGILNHMLEAMATQAKFDLNISVERCDYLYLEDVHHVVEDIAIALGRSFDTALGNRSGITRSGNYKFPMDETLVEVDLDLSGRPFFTDYSPKKTFCDSFEGKVGALAKEEIKHFIISFINNAKISMSVCLWLDGNDHHKLEAFFKALGRALFAATRFETRLIGKVLSTKGKLGESET